MSKEPQAQGKTIVTGDLVQADFVSQKPKHKAGVKTKQIVKARTDEKQKKDKTRDPKN